MILPHKKVRKNFWEQFFAYPSFNIRFCIILFFVLIIFCVVSYLLLFRSQLIVGVPNTIAAFTLIVQVMAVILGVLAAYYALRQLVETRFTGLDEAAMNEMRNKHYSRAFEKWKEAFYIRREAGVFTNMCESLLLIGDYYAFDQYVKISEKTGFCGKEIFQEISDQIVILYLKSVRHLLVKNQGEAEKYITSLIKLVSKESLLGFNWNFLDLRNAPSYNVLVGECKYIAENLLLYLENTIQPKRKSEFEKGLFSSQVKEDVSSESTQQ